MFLNLIHPKIYDLHWKQYRDLDFRRIFASMEKPAFVFDGRNCLDHAALHAVGFNVCAIGKRAWSHL